MPALWKVLVTAGVIMTSVSPRPSSSSSCSQLEDTVMMSKGDAMHGTIRRVDASAGKDVEDCLNASLSVAGSAPPPPCKTLSYALHGENVSSPVDGVTLLVGPGSYQLTSPFQIIDSHRVSLIASTSEETRVMCGGFSKPCSYVNFQIRNSDSVFVSGLTFTGCGPITSAVYIAHSSSVTFEKCVFRDNRSPPLLVYNSSPFVLNGTTFRDNHPESLNSSITSSTCYFSGGIDVFFLDNRTSSGGLSHYSEDSKQDLVITDCTFSGNSARPQSTVSLPRQSQGYGHGGAIILRFSNSSGGLVCMRNSTFERNMAEAQAGGMALSIGGSSANNTVEITDCTFCDNFCTLERSTGGAIGVDFFFDTYLNEVLIRHTDFIRNKADTGGAISLSTSVGIAPSGNADESDTLILQDCQFEENQAFFEGTALGVFSLTHTSQVGIPIEIIECHFCNNFGSNGSKDTTALTGYRVLISFWGYSTFVNNTGGGVTLLGSRMDVRGQVVFDRNSAVFGAGVAGSGRSLLLLYNGSKLFFTNNKAVDEGGGMYIEYTSSDFVLPVLNRGCFVQYFTTSVDKPPFEWNAEIIFINNTAGIAGAAIFANDMTRCTWLGSTNFSNTYFIFNTPEEYRPSPFRLKNNTVIRRVNSVTITDEQLATDASVFTAETQFGEDSVFGFGEVVSLRLFSSDQLGNFREAVWSLQSPLEDQPPLGALSSNGIVYEYTIPSLLELNSVEGLEVEGERVNITLTFSLLNSQATPNVVVLRVSGCHPGYHLDTLTQMCVCDQTNTIIIQCVDDHRYFYAREGHWVGVREDNSLFSSTTVPGFLDCSRQGALPGCQIRYDNLKDQCASGRSDTLCGECQEEYGVTFDLRFCRKDCGAKGIALFIIFCLLTIVLSLAVLYFDLPLPDELKGVIFFAQVIGVIYRNTPYLLGNKGGAYEFFDIVINLFGFSLPFPLCLGQNIPAAVMAFLGFIPPALATVVTILYIFMARRFRFLSDRHKYGFNGFHFLYLFVYKYFLDTSFIFISCTRLDDTYVFIYQGTIKCFEIPFVFYFTLSLLAILFLGLIMPAALLFLVYRPQKHVQAADALTRGLKTRRRYRWYGVWDIWRRILFVAANLFISITTRNAVLLIHCLLILLCLIIICVVKPYKKQHINVSETLIILSLFGATIAILDDEDLYVGSTVGIVFSILPLLYGVLFISYIVLGLLWRRLFSRRLARIERAQKMLDVWNRRWRRLKEEKIVTQAVTIAHLVAGRDTAENTDSLQESTVISNSSRNSGNRSTGDSSQGEGGGGGSGGGGGGRQVIELSPRNLSSIDLREPLLESYPSR